MVKPNDNQKESWDKYYERTSKFEPSKGLEKAVELLGHGGRALDLGCGAGRDSGYLVDNGFQVIALDSEGSSEIFINRLKNRGDIRFVQCSYDQYEFPIEHFDIINAHYALPFNPPDTFNEVFEKLKASLKPGGIFTGQLFGSNDEWNKPGSKMTFHTKQEALQLLEGLEIIKFEEVDDPNSSTANGAPKHWHYFNILARKT